MLLLVFFCLSGAWSNNWSGLVWHMFDGREIGPWIGARIPRVAGQDNRGEGSRRDGNCIGTGTEYWRCGGDGDGVRD